MKLIQELSGLSSNLLEGRAKDAIMDLIDRAISATTVSGMSYKDAVEAIAKTVHQMDDHELAGDHNMLVDMIKAHFDEEDLREDMQDGAEQTGPREIAKADEFKIMYHDAEESIDLVDGEGTIRVSMPMVVWKQLTRQ